MTTASALGDGRHTPCVHAEAGFSLLEIIVALGILAVGISSAFALFAAATAAHKRAVDRSRAAAIAEQVFADVESALHGGRSLDEVIESPPIADVAASWPGYRVYLEFHRVAGELESDELLLVVTVEWAYRGRDRRERFAQILVRREPTR